MKYLNNFSISYAGLALGHHVFKFEVGKEFFACFESSEISNGEVEIIVELEKSVTIMELNFKISGKVEVMCDRCADNFFLPVESSERLLVKFGNEDFENTDEIIVLPHSESELKLAHIFYEFLCLSLPIKRVHPEGECNQEVLDKLEQYKTQNEEETIDPRWEILKNIKLN